MQNQSEPTATTELDLPDCAVQDAPHLYAQSSTHPLHNIAVTELQLDAITTMLKALADSNRLQLLLLLQQCTQPLCVSDIAEATEDKITTVSNRLKQLHDAGLVSKQRDGQHILYALQDDHVEALLSNLMAHASHEHTS